MSQRQKEAERLSRENQEVRRRFQAQCQALEEERDTLMRRIQELDAGLKDAHQELANADQGHKGAQAQVRLLQSKLEMLEQDLSHQHR